MECCISGLKYLFQAINVGKIESPSLSHSFNQACTRRQGPVMGIYQRSHGKLFSISACIVCLYWGQSLWVLSHICMCTCNDDFLQCQRYSSPWVPRWLGQLWVVAHVERGNSLLELRMQAVEPCGTVQSSSAIPWLCYLGRLLSPLTAVSTAVKLESQYLSYIRIL